MPALTNQTGLYALSIFRFEEMIFEAQKLRLIEAFTYPHDAASKAIMDARLRDETLASSPPFERFVFRIAQQVAGFFSLVPAIREAFKGPRFDQGYPEQYPTFEELDSGEVVSQTNASPPPALPADG